MNTKPDDTTLALWLDDELHGEALAAVEAWAAQHPEQLAAREEIRRWRRMIGRCIPASEEPPAAEFFNERIQHAIRSSTPTSSPARRQSRTRWWLPLAACAGMTLAFWLGMIAKHQDRSAARETPVPARELPHVYTPVQGVEAEFFTSNPASATVIVLKGVDAIPDTIDFSVTASDTSWREADSTADVEGSPDTQP